MNEPAAKFALFDYGFRPFFLLSGIWAAVAVPVWLLMLLGGFQPSGALTPQLWHAHEMLFGFVVAAIAGFLLTAVPSWTGEKGFSGTPLIVLTVLWLAGRVVMTGFPLLPSMAAAIIDVAFLPALGLMIAPSLVCAGKSRNLVFLVFLLALLAGNLLFHAGLERPESGFAPRGLLLAVDTVLLVVTIIGGRIVPAFTLSAMRRTDDTFAITPFPALDRAAVASIVAVLIIDLFWPASRAAGAAAILAALLHLARLLRWKTLRGRGIPLVWILHVAYAWIVTGLVLKGLHLAVGLPDAWTWMHALTVGGFGSMILAVMTRAALGHTGRPLVAPAPIVAAYGLITLAALGRVFGPLLPASYLHTIVLSGSLWAGAFVLFLIVYTPILTRPRADGKPG
jgi:uncharacterized protein involved in response to NO